MTSVVEDDDDLLKAMDINVAKKPKVNDCDVIILSEDNPKNQSMTTQISFQDKQKGDRLNRYQIDQDEQIQQSPIQSKKRAIEFEFEVEQEEIATHLQPEKFQENKNNESSRSEPQSQVPPQYPSKFPKKQQKVKNLKKTDFNYKNQSKTRNILDDEQEIGEVGEWVEKTCNQKLQDSEDSQDDEFEQAFQDGEKKGREKPNEIKKQENQMKKFSDDFDDDNMQQQQQESQNKIKEQQIRANLKVKKIEKGGYKSGNSGGFMINKLQSKAKFMHLENQEQNPENLDIEEKVILTGRNSQLKDIQQHDIKVSQQADESQNESEQEEHQDVVIIDQDRLSSPQKKNSKIIDENEWEMINQQALQNQNRRLSTQKEIQQITYIDAWKQVKQTDLTHQVKQVQCKEKKQQSFLQRISQMCSRSNTLNRPSLLNERDQILAFSNVKFDDKEKFHFQMLYTIFCQLKNTDHCLRYGNHWQDIGFQGTDPASDLRSTGMFSILQYLGFVNSHKKYLQFVMTYKTNFPLSITLINISKFTLEFLQQGLLDDMINQEKQVMNVLNKVYFATFYLLFEKFQKENNEEKIGILLQQVQEVGGKTPKRNCDNFMKFIEKFYKDNEDQQFEQNEQEDGE